MQLKQYEKAITEYEKALSIYNHWGAKPGWIYNYTELGNAYHKTGRFNKEKELYEKAQLDFPDDYELIYRQAVLALTIKDSVSANNLIRKYVADRRSNVVADSLIAKKVDEMFSEAGVTNKPGTFSTVSVTSER
jgi:tetratricopeptide (TPR) repeat protein